LLCCLHSASASPLPHLPLFVQHRKPVCVSFIPSDSSTLPTTTCPSSYISTSLIH
jgi:hypothetical protein